MQGKVRLGKRTKELAPLLKPGEIAVICHEDLDAVGASGLIEAGVAAVINARNSFTCRYPNLGPQLLIDHGIALLDNVGEAIFTKLEDGDVITIEGRKIISCNKVIAVGTVATEHLIQERRNVAQRNLSKELDIFVANTLEYAAKEKDAILGNHNFPPLNVVLKDKTVVVVVRGLGYKDDLRILSPFIHETKPILVGVDGGADALLAFGYKPHLVVGDMDSVSDSALTSGAQILAHAYVNGTCPCANRLENLGLDYDQIHIPGTSEDLALLLSHSAGAKLIVLVGSHSNMIDFLEKGRPGMASTFLTRLKIGSLLLDAKRVSELYRPGPSVHVFPVVLAALIPILIFLSQVSPWRYYLRLFWLQLRLIAGWL
ncbi:MAG: putative cytokinetic ring protein SteA [Bacillota bacterium]|nr:putative cytokinetic ring protein SteA [Bacillota bacterium]